MRLFGFTALAMLAFAANSLLNRLALLEGAIGPASFAAVRVASGVAVLLALIALRERALPHPVRPDLAAVAGLAAYMIGFSFAYVALDAGIGALVLFGGVQITMFLGAFSEGERPPLRRWAGVALAFTGLALLSWPNGGALMPPGAMALMGLAAIGWGAYSLMGRRAADPLAATGWNFAYALPVTGVVVLAVPDEVPVQTTGLLLAMLSGGVTSALGYALWYKLLPQLGATRAALAQLSVPAIALALGALLLGEAVGLTALISAAIILGGIALGLAPNRRG